MLYISEIIVNNSENIFLNFILSNVRLSSRRNSINPFFYVFMCVPVWGLYLCEFRCPQKPEVLDPPEQELQAGGNCFTWLLGTGQGSSGRAAHAFNGWAICLDLCNLFCLSKNSITVEQQGWLNGKQCDLLRRRDKALPGRKCSAHNLGRTLAVVCVLVHVTSGKGVDSVLQDQAHRKEPSTVWYREQQ